MSDRSGEPVGTLAEELAKLMGVVSGFAESAAPGDKANTRGDEDGDAGADSAAEHGEHIADGSAACQMCPVCQTIAFVRSTSPEVREHLASSAASFAAATRDLLDGIATQHQHPERPRKSSHVENIDLSEDEQWD